jgi:TatD DNase family protein
MSNKQPYINLHSHSKPEPNEVSIRNIFLQDFFANDLHESQLVSVGFHPWHITEKTDILSTKAGLEIAARCDFVFAIGETGLDKSINFPMEAQEEIFRTHVTVSEVNKKPLIIHCVRAFQEILSIRKESKPRQTWIFHGFNGSAQLAKQIIDAGCVVSYGNAILKENTRAVHSLLHLNPGQFFLETDDTDTSIFEIYQMAAIIKQVSVDELIEKLFFNFAKIFGYKRLDDFSSID